MSALTDRPAHELAAMLARREISCRELMQATLARIDAVNPVHNAIVSLRDDDVLLAEADARDRAIAAEPAPAAPRSFLFGLPQAIKDIVPTAGLRSTMGSRLADHVPEVDGLLAERMKAAGCVLVGKTNTPEFGFGSHTFNEVFGATRNAFDPSKSAGGSSGGAAVALATRMLSVADGSDSMGSLRNPAGWNNVFGFRPSQGRVPTWPAADAWVTHFGTDGPMARTVTDLALLLDVQAGYDARAPLSLATEPSFAARLDTDPSTARPLRIGWLGDLGGHLAMEPGVLATCERALQRLAGTGMGVEPVSLGFAPERIWDAWLTLRWWVNRCRIAPFLKRPADRELVKPEALWEHDNGAALTATDVMAASIERTAFYQHVLGLFRQVDFLALPSAQVWPFPVEERWPKTIAGRAMDTYHRWMEVVVIPTFAGLPAVSMPAGFSAAGLPMGLQLIGPPRGDLELLRAARAYERVAADVLALRPS